MRSNKEEGHKKLGEIEWNRIYRGWVYLKQRGKRGLVPVPSMGGACMDRATNSVLRSPKGHFFALGIVVDLNEPFPDAPHCCSCICGQIDFPVVTENVVTLPTRFR